MVDDTGTPIDQKEDIYLVIDGKQRINAALDYYAGKFSCNFYGEDYFWEDLPHSWKTYWKGYTFRSVVLYGEFTDEDKLGWFLRLNYGGTPQDDEHLAWVRSAMESKG